MAERAIPVAFVCRDPYNRSAMFPCPRGAGSIDKEKSRHWAGGLVGRAHYSDAMVENELKGVFDIPIKIIYVVNITIETICAHPHCPPGASIPLPPPRQLLMLLQAARQLTFANHRYYSFVSSPRVSPSALFCTITIIIIRSRSGNRSRKVEAVEALSGHMYPVLLS